ncbi:MAG: hypothetical protein CMN76_09615 [Spirochaetaceae bacterium]|nr:hypothetical protein [Spirochaetaceae bacterium]|tara:strand:+ start:89114 stop:89467 length:354 start_codon:yes stop_codon:yes gene_type:complete
MKKGNTRPMAQSSSSTAGPIGSSRGRPFLATLLLIGFVALFTGCNAEPNATDVQRVKDEFLHLRFQARIQPSLKGQPDARLFQMACQNNNVQCDKVLQKLKESDPDFYKVLEKELDG